MKVGQIWSRSWGPGYNLGYRVIAVFPKSASVNGQVGFVWLRQIKGPYPMTISLEQNDSMTAPISQDMTTWSLIEDVP